MFTRYFIERKIHALLALTVLLLLLLAGCGNSTSASLSNATTASTPTPSGATAAMATLKSEPTGTANLTWNHTDHMLTVQVMLTGLAPNSIHPAHIHEGSCSNNKEGKVVYPLLNIVADAKGVANSSSKISVPGGIPARGWYLNIHNGPGVSIADQGLFIACGDIVNHDTSLRSTQAVQLTLQTNQDSMKGEHISGTAHLSVSNHVLTVQMTLSGLEPKSEHAAHIHAGSCASQGAVIYTLPMIKADALGKATVTTTIQNVSSIPDSGWYINVHHGTDMSTQTGFDPIACGDVTTA